MFFRRRPSARRHGCSLLVTATFVTCVLLLINRIVAASLYRLAMPPAFDHPKVRTIILMLAIVGLLLPEWWFIDSLLARSKSLYRWIEAAKRADDQ